jgi:tetratricopeptide (TPR) repeat protein
MAEFAERIKPRAQYVDEAIELALANRWVEAVQVNRGIMDRFGPDEDTLNRLGKAYTELGQLTEATDAYKGTLKMNPHLQGKGRRRRLHRGDRQNLADGAARPCRG